jgi:hypothetical protein
MIAVSYNVLEELVTRCTLAPDDHDIVLWMGDLNYRITEELDLEKCYEYIDAGNMNGRNSPVSSAFVITNALDIHRIIHGAHEIRSVNTRKG